MSSPNLFTQWSLMCSIHRLQAASPHIDSFVPPRCPPRCLAYCLPSVPLSALSSFPPHCICINARVLGTEMMSAWPLPPMLLSTSGSQLSLSCCIPLRSHQVLVLSPCQPWRAVGDHPGCMFLLGFQGSCVPLSVSPFSDLIVSCCRWVCFVP